MGTVPVFQSLHQLFPCNRLPASADRIDSRPNSDRFRDCRLTLRVASALGPVTVTNDGIIHMCEIPDVEPRNSADSDESSAPNQERIHCLVHEITETGQRGGAWPPMLRVLP
jgi:hypothetical protein